MTPEEERAIALIEKLQARLEAVKALHYNSGLKRVEVVGQEEVAICAHCIGPWPCPTLRAVEGKP